NSQDPLYEMTEFNAGRIGFVPPGIVLRIRRHRACRREFWLLQLHSEVGADRIANLFEGIAVRAIDTVKVSDAEPGHVGHNGETALNASVVAVIGEAIVKTPVITQAIYGFQAFLPRPGALRNFHPIDV